MAAHPHVSSPIELPVDFVEELSPALVDRTPRRGAVKSVESRSGSVSSASSPALEVLHGAFMFLSGLARRKRSKVFPAA